MTDIQKGPPVFTMLMGLPGAGKSTLRTVFKGECCIQLSTDDLIEDAAKWKGQTYSEAFVDEIKPAMAAVNTAFLVALKDGASIIWDQTNLSVKKRKGVLSQVPAGYHKVIIVVKCDEAERQIRLGNRPGKVIPPHIDQSMRENFTMPTFDEGWNEIMVHNT